MTREELFQHILDVYAVEPDYPWAKYPEYAVFRHANNKKWFALVSVVERDKLGLSGQGLIDIVNVKCDPILIGSLLAEPGFFPGYHMNKGSWLTMALDGSADSEKIKFLLNISYDLTGVKTKKRKKEPEEQD